MENTKNGLTEYKSTPLERARWRIWRWWDRLFPRPSNLELHAERELRAAGIYDKDADYNGGLGRVRTAYTRLRSERC